MPSAVWKQALTLIAAEIESIAVTMRSEGLALTKDATVVRQLSWKDVSKTLGRSVRWKGNPVLGRGTNERDLWGYPCHVILCQGHRDAFAEETEAHFSLLQRIRRRYNEKRRLTSVSDTCTTEFPCTVRSGPNPPASFADNLDIHTLTIVAWFMEPRDA